MRILHIILLGSGIVLLPAAAPRDSGVTPAEPQRCHPSYPDFCIAPPPPDLDCGDIPASRKPFRVRHDVANPDPHRFDRDRDGRACEPRPRPRG
jgi:micrococcal nuclease